MMNSQIGNPQIGDRPVVSTLQIGDCLPVSAIETVQFSTSPDGGNRLAVPNLPERPQSSRTRRLSSASQSRRTRQRGSAVVEMSLMMPWIAFLFVGILDFGFYAYAAIATQTAARTAAMQSAIANDVSQACTAALNELKGLPNVGSIVSCGALPVIVTATVLNAGTTPPCADCSLNATATSAQVTVTYQSIPMIPIPGVLTARLTLSRIAEVRMVP